MLCWILTFLLIAAFMVKLTTKQPIAVAEPLAKPRSIYPIPRGRMN